MVREAKASLRTLASFLKSRSIRTRMGILLRSSTSRRTSCMISVCSEVAPMQPWLSPQGPTLTSSSKLISASTTPSASNNSELRRLRSSSHAMSRHQRLPQANRISIFRPTSSSLSSLIRPLSTRLLARPNSKSTGRQLPTKCRNWQAFQKRH